jgi:short-subunit dehydrogenase
MNILITGAKSGIGYATALELLNRGHFVYLTVHTDEQLKGLHDREELNGKNVQCFRLDITHKEDREVVKDLDIDVLINNAAIGNGGSIVEASMARLRETFEVNFFATVELSKLFLTKMVEDDKGRIIMISSMIGEVPMPWLGMYSATKAALTNITMALSKELEEVESNVKVCIIEPGFYKTGFNEVMMDNKYDNEHSIFQNYRKKIYDAEHKKVDTLSTDDLKSIVDKIVTAVEAPKPDLIYKAPFGQAVMEKAYILKNK